MADETNQPQPGEEPAPAPVEASADDVLAAAEAAIKALQDETPPASAANAAPAAAPAPSPSPGTDGAIPFQMPDLKMGSAAAMPAGISLLADVNMNVKIELGRTRMLVEDVLRLAEGSVVELDKLAGDPVDVYVNDRHVARGEVLVLNDNFCVRISEILAPVSAEEARQAATAA